MGVSRHRETNVPKLIASCFLEIQNWGRRRGKLSNQTPSVKSRLMAQGRALPSNSWGNRVD